LGEKNLRWVGQKNTSTVHYQKKRRGHRDVTKKKKPEFKKRGPDYNEAGYEKERVRMGRQQRTLKGDLTRKKKKRNWNGI